MNLATDTWLSLALQIPLALVIVFLVIKFLDYLRNNQELTMKFIENQSVTYREFLIAQREQTNLALGRLAEEIKTSKMDTLKEVANLTNAIDRSLDKLARLEDRFTKSIGD